MSLRSRRTFGPLVVLMCLAAACTSVPQESDDIATDATEPAAPMLPSQPEAAFQPPRLTENALAATEQSQRAEKRSTAASVGRDSPVQATDMVDYSNAALGLSFSYPAELGETEFDMASGDTGYAWGLGFSRFNALWFAGRSTDFSEGRGGQAEDTLGFTRDPDGQYRWRTVPASVGMEVDVNDVLEVDGREILLFRVPNLWGVPDNYEPGTRAALVNLAGQQFPGMIVLAPDSERLPGETFRAILLSIRTEQPTESPPTP